MRKQDEFFTFRLDSETRDWLKRHAAASDRTEGAVVRRAVREYRQKEERRAQRARGTGGT